MNKKTSTKKKPTEVIASNGQNGQPEFSPRLNILKTYKLYIGGKFPRTESGRVFAVKSAQGKHIANMCQGSRKDFREAVVKARGALKGWSGKTAYNRSQILYRIAEMLETRKAQFVEELQQLGATLEAAQAEVTASIDRTVYYAGWADKYQQVFSSVNPVASSHFNFSVLEPTGVVTVFAPEENGLLGLVSAVMPVICGGNTCVVLASSKYPTCAITFAEVLHSSDVPGGVINIMTGFRAELLPHFATHKDVNAMVYCGNNTDQIKAIQQHATQNVKRVALNKTTDWYADEAQHPYLILDTQETKTTWHPVGSGISGAGAY